MPSLAFSDLKEKKEEKSMKKKIALETPESEKKTNKVKEPNAREEGSDSAMKKSKKKRKASELQLEEEEKSDTSSDLVEPMDVKEKKKKKKKSKVEEEGDEDEGKSEDADAISNFRISEPLREKLKSKGIESLFPTPFDHVFGVNL